MTDVRLSLISHTNVGKTTLMRTLLRRDVGEVFDLVHVTRDTEAHVAIETGDDRLVLNDTPGFGNTARLLERLRREPNPLTWLLERLRRTLDDKERTLALNAEAVRAVKEQTDVVLYLVDASQDPELTGYAPYELELLTWLERPALIVLNYTVDTIGADEAGGDELERERSAELAELRRRWEAFAERWDVVRGVLSLDAFGRCWVEETTLLEQVVGLLDGERRAAMERLADAWRRRDLDVLDRSSTAIAEVLVEAARDEASYPLDGAVQWLRDRVVGRLGLGRGAEHDAARAAFEAMVARLEQRLQRCVGELVTAHGLDGRSRQRFTETLAALQLDGDLVRRRGVGTLLGAVVSGAVTGLGADIVAGGLTLGGGALLGALAGALGGAGLERVVHVVRGDDEGAGAAKARWSHEFLDALVERLLVSYLAVAHHGRGRGEFRDGDVPERWRRAVAAAVDARRGEWHRAWDAARAGRGEAEIHAASRATIEGVLVRGYDSAARLFATRADAGAVSRGAPRDASSPRG